MNRFLDIQGAYNVRDIGGYPTKNGGTVQWQKVFRSGKISQIKDTENEKMAAMNIKAICDFRTLAEQESSPDKWHNLENIKRFQLPIGEGRLDKLAWMKKVAQGTGKDSHLYKANQFYVLENSHRFRAFFEVLLDESNYPLLYHCTAGKDRTGFATLLLLSALGVDKAIIIEDYLLSNDHLGEFFWKDLEVAAAKSGMTLQQIKPILVADKAYIQGAFDAITEHFGTIENYLREEISIGKPEIQQLQSLLVLNS